MDSNTIHGPTGQKTVTQHPGRFWMLTCFDVSRWLRWNFEVKPVALERLWNYLSRELENVENGVCMRPGHQFWCGLLLDSEVDSKLSWTRLPTGGARPPCSPARPWCSISTPCPSPSFLSTSTSLGSNLFSFSQLEEQRNEFTCCFSWCARDLVMGPCIKIGGMVISVVLISSSQVLYAL